MRLTKALVILVCGLAAAGAAGAQTADYTRGQSDRQAYEAWVRGLGGDSLAGASYWQSHRSTPNAPACDDPNAPTTGDTWQRGCEAAKEKLDEADALRRESASYRAGWNHPEVAAGAGASADAASAPGGTMGARAADANTPSVPDGAAVNAAIVPAPTAATPPVPAPPADAQTPAEILNALTPPANQATTASGGMHAFGIAIVVAAVLGVLVSLLIYFVPSIIAFRKKKRNAGAILALNFFLGWSLIGWVLSLVWSLMQDPPAPAR